MSIKQRKHLITWLTCTILSIIFIGSVVMEVRTYDGTYSIWEFIICLFIAVGFIVWKEWDEPYPFWR